MDITLHGNVADFVHKQTELGGYESHEDLVYDALKALVSKKIEEGIDEGIADIEAGRYVEINQDNLDLVLSKPVDQWLK